MACSDSSFRSLDRTENFQILSLSGGGYLGLFSARILEELEAVAGRPVRECFDLVAGTSIGGVLGLCVSAGVPMAKVRASIEQNGSKVFGLGEKPRSGFVSSLKLAKGLRTPKYQPGPLKQLIADLLDEDLRLSDLDVPILVPAVNMTRGKPTVFKTPHHPNFFRDQYLCAVDVALATTAAPTYFPLHPIAGELYADGGLFANCPDEIALFEALHYFGISQDKIRMLSIGTPNVTPNVTNRDGRHYGVWQWLSNQMLPSIMLSVQLQNTQFMMAHRLNQNYINISEELPQAASRTVGLDVASDSACRDILGFAESVIRTRVGAIKKSGILQHKSRGRSWYSQKPP